MRLILTRHGRTEGNIARILAGIDDPLSKEGKKQVELVSRRLSTEQIEVIYCSPLPRALNTAKEIAKNHPRAKFIIADELKEMYFGSYLNKDYDSVDWNKLPGEIESRTSMYKRAKFIIDKAKENYPDKTVLFVAHNALNKAIIRYLKKLDPEDRGDIPQDNTAITIFEITENETKEILFNCTKHLD